MNKTHLGLGAFVLVTLGLVLWLAQNIGEFGRASGRRLTVRMPHAAGLVENNTVRIAGVRVGTIERVGVDHDAAVLTVQVDDGVTLFDDTRAIVRAKSLLGEKYLQLHPGTQGHPPLDFSAPLANVEIPFEIDEVLNALEPILGGDESVAASLAPLAARADRVLAAATGDDGKPPVITREEITTALEDVRVTLATVRRILERNEQGVAELVDKASALAGDPRIPQILDHVNSITRVLDDRLPGLIDRADRAMAVLDRLERELSDERAAKLGATIDDGRAAVASLRTLAKDLEGVSGDLSPLVKHLGQLAARGAKIDEKTLRDFLQKEGVKIYIGSGKQARAVAP